MRTQRIFSPLSKEILNWIQEKMKFIRNLSNPEQKRGQESCKVLELNMELFLEKNFSVNEVRNNFSSFYVFHSLTF